MRRLQVRCCCQPKKILGTLPVPDIIRSGQCITYLKNTLQSGGHVETITLPIATIYSRRTQDYSLALKAEGVPIEVLRTINGFQEERPI